MICSTAQQAVRFGTEFSWKGRKFIASGRFRQVGVEHCLEAWDFIIRDDRAYERPGFQLMTI